MEKSTQLVFMSFLRFTKNKKRSNEESRKTLFEYLCECKNVKREKRCASEKDLKEG